MIGLTCAADSGVAAPCSHAPLGLGARGPASPAAAMARAAAAAACASGEPHGSHGSKAAVAAPSTGPVGEVRSRCEAATLGSAEAASTASARPRQGAAAAAVAARSTARSCSLRWLGGVARRCGGASRPQRATDPRVPRREPDALVADAVSGRRGAAHPERARPGGGGPRHVCMRRTTDAVALAVAPTYERWLVNRQSARRRCAACKSSRAGGSLCSAHEDAWERTIGALRTITSVV